MRRYTRTALVTAPFCFAHRLIARDVVAHYNARGEIDNDRERFAGLRNSALQDLGE
jgi:hypothetical protein